MISTPASTALWPATAQWRPDGGEQQAADGGGIEGLEGSTHGHDVIPVDLAIAHLEKRGLDAAATVLKGIIKSVHSATLLGSGQRLEANRNVFGDAVVELLAAMPQPVRKDNVLLVDSDLEGSCGLAQIRKAYPEIFVRGGIMERANFSAAAGFGMEAGRR